MISNLCIFGNTLTINNYTMNHKRNPLDANDKYFKRWLVNVRKVLLATGKFPNGVHPAPCAWASLYELRLTPYEAVSDNTGLIPSYWIMKQLKCDQPYKYIGHESQT